MIPRPERFANDRSTGVELNALHWGDEGNPPLILLHGGGANAHWWDHIAPSLADRHHVVALDFRGHGDSDHPDELKTGAFNDDLEALIHHLGSEEAFLLGHSMGAHVAVDHASRNGDIRALCLIDMTRGGSKRSRRVARLALGLRGTYSSREEAIARFQFLPSAECASEELRVAIARNSVQRDDDGRYGFKFDPRWFGVPPRPRPNLARVRCPTLLIRGGSSALLTSEGAREIIEELPDAQCIEVPGAGHQVHLDHPQQLVTAVRSFLHRHRHQ